MSDAEAGIAGMNIVLTGGASGMGAALVGDLVRRGAHVVSLDVADEAGRAVVAKAAGHNSGRADYLHCDVSNEASVEQAFAGALDLLGGRLNALIAAAGIAPAAPAQDITAQAWEKVFGVNVTGTFLANRAAFPHLQKNGGRIINFGSIAGASGYPGKAHYAASKGAVLAWTRSIAHEWGRYGITVNSLVPAISTPMYETTRASMSPEQLAAHDERLKELIPIDGKLGDPDRDLVPVVRFLLGEGARFITGQMIAVDGGMLMVR